MRRSKGFVLRAAVTVAALVACMLVGAGCRSDDLGQAQTEASGPGQTEQMMQDRPTDGHQPGMPLAEVAEILGIDQQDLENAFATAQNEVAGNGMPVLPDESEPDGTPPQGDSPPAREQLSDDILSRVSEILGIDQQDLEDAFAQVRDQVSEGVPRKTL
jgi:hypothetical protein